MDGPGNLLGYGALRKKLRQVHELNVSRDVVCAVMYNVDPVALDERAQFKKKKPKRQLQFTWLKLGALPRWSR